MEFEVKIFASQFERSICLATIREDLYRLLLTDLLSKEDQIGGATVLLFRPITDGIGVSVNLDVLSKKDEFFFHVCNIKPVYPTKEKVNYLHDLFIKSGILEKRFTLIPLLELPL